MRWILFFLFFISFTLQTMNSFGSVNRSMIQSDPTAAENYPTWHLTVGDIAVTAIIHKEILHDRSESNRNEMAEEILIAAAEAFNEEKKEKNISGIIQVEIRTFHENLHREVLKIHCIFPNGLDQTFTFPSMEWIKSNYPDGLSQFFKDLLIYQDIFLKPQYLRDEMKDYLFKLKAATASLPDNDKFFINPIIMELERRIRFSHPWLMTATQFMAIRKDLQWIANTFIRLKQIEAMVKEYAPDLSFDPPSVTGERSKTLISHDLPLQRVEPMPDDRTAIIFLQKLKTKYPNSALTKVFDNVHDQGGKIFLGLTSIEKKSPQRNSLAQLFPIRRIEIIAFIRILIPGQSIPDVSFTVKINTSLTPDEIRNGKGIEEWGNDFAEALFSVFEDEAQYRVLKGHPSPEHILPAAPACSEALGGDSKPPPNQN